MKTNEYVGDTAMFFAPNTASPQAEMDKRTIHTENPTAEARAIFPVKLFIVALLITAGTIAWTSWNLIRPMSFNLSMIVTIILLALCLGAWAAASRTFFHCRDIVLENTKEMALKAQLLKERDLLRMVIDDLPDLIYAKDTEGRFVLTNAAHAKSLGAQSPADMVGKSDFDFFPKDLAAQFYSDEKKIIQTGEPILNQEQFKPVHDSNEMRWSYSSKVLWRDGNGEIIGTAGITRDIHKNKMTEDALRKSEEKLRQFTGQLERSNRELQDFAYVASHDLQEPLRKIVVFGERLKEKCSEALEGDGRDYLERMQKAASRMQVLISDLLTFSRVTSKAHPFAPTALSHIASEVVEDLQGRIEQVKGRVEIGALPIIDAEALQMRQLLQNLIGNALKFRRPEALPVVTVAARVYSGIAPRSAPGATSQQLCELTVSDNGIGFDEKYLDRIFNVFQRLHTRNEYEGTGMGLAICRKIAFYHGGDITANSKPGHGTTFIVTLPVVHPKEETHD